MMTTKYVLQQTGGDLGQGQTIIMDPSQLQGIIQGGGSITLGAGGKVRIYDENSATYSSRDS